jgi:hypothetical protein
MAAKLARPTQKLAIQLHLVAESCIICSSRSMRPVRKLLDTFIHFMLHRPSVAAGSMSLLEIESVSAIIRIIDCFKNNIARKTHGSVI